MATKKLYWDDPHATSFRAEGLSLSTWEGKPAAVLPETVFYAEGGGQLGDAGTLRVGSAELRVTDTQIDEDGTIFHILEHAPAEPPRGEVVAEIDVVRRRDMMAHHTAQHMLSRALLDVARAPTASARLGASSCTLDLDKPQISDADLAKAEDLVNAVVRDDLPVRAFFPTADELAKIDLRRAPKVATGVRIVEVERFDFTPCGGTHVTRTGQIGMVRVVGTERYKGKTRAFYTAAIRTLDDARTRDKVLADLARDLTCGPLDVGASVARLKSELKERVDALARARGELTRAVAAELLAAHPRDESGTTIVRLLRDGDDVGSLRTLAGRLTERPDVVAICASLDAKTADFSVVVQKGASASFDCGAWLKETAQRLGGRGGGRPGRAEGRLPATFAAELGTGQPMKETGVR